MCCYPTPRATQYCRRGKKTIIGWKILKVHRHFEENGPGYLRLSSPYGEHHWAKGRNEAADCPLTDAGYDILRPRGIHFYADKKTGYGGSGRLRVPVRIKPEHIVAAEPAYIGYGGKREICSNEGTPRGQLRTRNNNRQLVASEVELRESDVLRAIAEQHPEWKGIPIQWAEPKE